MFPSAAVSSLPTNSPLAVKPLLSLQAARTSLELSGLRAGGQPTAHLSNLRSRTSPNHVPADRNNAANDTLDIGPQTETGPAGTALRDLSNDIGCALLHDRLHASALFISSS